MANKSLVISHADHRFEQSRDAMWAKMCELQEFSVRCIADWCHIKQATIKTYVKGLLKAGFIEPFEKADKEARYQRHWYRVAKAQRETPRVTKRGEPVTQGSVQDNIWRNLSILKEFDTRTMFMVCNTESSPTTPLAVKRYLVYLHQAGYIIQRGKGTASYWRWLPAKWTGPKAPKIMRSHEVWDANLKEVVWSEHQETEGGAAHA